MRCLALLVVTALLVGATAGCAPRRGSAVRSTDERTVTIVMTDDAYSPSTVTVAADSEVTFAFVNRGRADHDAFIGTSTAQLAEPAAMASNGAGRTNDHPNGVMFVGHSDQVLIPPGRSGSLSYRFGGRETLVLGCHQPGHYEAGMKVLIRVV